MSETEKWPELWLTGVFEVEESDSDVIFIEKRSLEGATVSTLLVLLKNALTVRKNGLNYGLRGVSRSRNPILTSFLLKTRCGGRHRIEFAHFA